MKIECIFSVEEGMKCDDAVVLQERKIERGFVLFYFGLSRI